MSKEDIITAPLVDPKADISIDRIHQVSTQNGRKEWVLDAVSAKMIEFEKRLWLKELSMIFYTKDGKEVHLTADEGFVNTQTRDINVAGNVVLKNEEFELTTERLHYKSRSRKLSSKTPVKITGRSAILRGNTLQYDINTRNARLKGNVSGIIDEQEIF